MRVWKPTIPRHYCCFREKCALGVQEDLKSRVLIGGMNNPSRSCSGRRKVVCLRCSSELCMEEAEKKH